MKAKQMRAAQKERAKQKAAIIEARAQERKEKMERKHAEQVAKRADLKLKAAAASAAKKFETCIASIQKSLRAPGANLVPVVAKEPLMKILTELEESLAAINAVAGGLATSAPMPDDLKHVFQMAKKHEALWLLSLRTYLSQQQLR